MMRLRAPLVRPDRLSGFQAFEMAAIAPPSRKAGAALLLLAGILVSIAGVSPGWALDPKSADAPFALAVTVSKVNRTCFVDTLNVTGNVVPRSEVLVRSEREGLFVSEVLAEAGETVRSGQVLARLKPPDAQRNTAAIDLVAPAAGVIFTAFATIGAPASPGGEPLFRIARDGELELVADVPVASMDRIAAQQPVKVKLIGVGEVDGTVRLASTGVNPTTQLGQVYILLRTQQRIRVGVFGRGTIQFAQRCGPALPLSAVLYGPAGAIVQIVRNNQVETRSVRVGQIKGGDVEIRRGVAEGESIVVRAGSFVRDGDLVQPVAAQARR